MKEYLNFSLPQLDLSLAQLSPSLLKVISKFYMLWNMICIIIFPKINYHVFEESNILKRGIFQTIIF